MFRRRINLPFCGSESSLLGNKSSNTAPSGAFGENSGSRTCETSANLQLNFSQTKASAEIPSTSEGRESLANPAERRLDVHVLRRLRLFFVIRRPIDGGATWSLNKDAEQSEIDRQVEE